MPLSVRFAEAASYDLEEMAAWLAERVDPEFAGAYVDRVRRRCESLVEQPRRGRVRRAGRKPIRSIPFRGKSVILYRVTRYEVVIERILHHGRDSDAIARGVR